MIYHLLVKSIQTNIHNVACRRTGREPSEHKMTLNSSLLLSTALACEWQERKFLCCASSVNPPQKNADTGVTPLDFFRFLQKVKIINPRDNISILLFSLLLKYIRE